MMPKERARSVSAQPQRRHFILISSKVEIIEFPILKSPLNHPECAYY
jgi:hypothetical protein